MSELREVTIDPKRGDVSVEVIVTHQKPASITVALYGTDRKKEKDLGNAFSGEPPDPDVFLVARKRDAPNLEGKIIGIVVAVSSFTPREQEPFTVISSLRQAGVTIPNGIIVSEGLVDNGGAGIIDGFRIGIVSDA